MAAREWESKRFVRESENALRENGLERRGPRSRVRGWSPHVYVYMCVNARARAMCGASRPCQGAWGTGVGLSLLPSASFLKYWAYGRRTIALLDLVHSTIARSDLNLFKTNSVEAKILRTLYFIINWKKLSGNYCNDITIRNVSCFLLRWFTFIFILYL